VLTRHPSPTLFPTRRSSDLDDDRVSSITRRLLIGQGYLVLEADDGYQALLVAQGHKGPIDLVITDVVMPRMGGLQLVAQLKDFRDRKSTRLNSSHLGISYAV